MEQPESRVHPDRWADHTGRAALLLGLLLAGLGVAKYGLTMWAGWPNLYEVAENWQDPTAGPLVQPPQDYILANAVPSLLLGIVGLTDQTVYVSAQVLLAIVAIVLPFTMPAARDSLATSRVMFVMLAGGPVLALLLTWIGGYDTLCVIGATIAVLARRAPVSALGWLLFALGHSTIAVVAFVLSSALLLLGLNVGDRRAAWVRMLWGLAGLAVGYVSITLLTSSWGGVTSRWEAYRLYSVDYYVNALIAGMPMIIFSALGVGWIVLLDRSVRRSRAAVLVLGFSLILSLVLPVLALDQTRTIALVTFPLVVAWAASVPRLYSGDIASRLWSRYAIAAAIVPVIIVGGGQWMASGWQSLLAWRSTF